MRREIETYRPLLECVSAVIVAIAIVAGAVLSAAYGPTLDEKATAAVRQIFKVSKKEYIHR
jgi:hypothetical protein